MNADWLFIDTDPTSAEVLAWTHQACQVLEMSATPPNTRIPTRNRQSAVAVTGVGAIALRTDDASALQNVGVDVLVGETAEPLDPEISWLQAMQPTSTVVLWDTPTLSAMYRHGVENTTVDLPQRSRALLEASNEIRRAALESSVYLQLLSPAGTDFDRYGVTVLTPGWATLQAIAQFAETDALAQAGLVPLHALDTEFQRAAATTVRAFTHFPEEVTSVVERFVDRGKATVDACLSVWGMWVPKMIDGFLHHAWDHRSTLRAIGSDRPGEYVQARTALRDLARTAGLAFGLQTGHDTPGHNAH